MRKTPERWMIAAALTVLIVVGALVRIELLFSRPLWDDELWHRFIVRQSSYPQFFLWGYEEMHPPMCFFLNRLFCDLLHADDALAWRLPSLIAGLLCIPAAYRLGGKIDSPWLGLGAAAMVTFDLNLTWESQNARMYTMFALLTIWTLSEAVPLLEKPTPRWSRWALLGALLALSIWTSLLAPLVWAAVGLSAGTLLVAHRFRPRPDFVPRHIFQGLTVAFGLALVLGAPGLHRFFSVSQGLEGIPVVQQTLPEIGRAVYWVTNLLIWIEVRLLSPLILLASLAGAILLARRCRSAALLLVFLGALTLASLFHIARSNPYIVMRYLVSLQPLIWIGLPFLLLRLPPPRWAPVGLVVFLIYLAVQAWNCTRLERTYGTVAVDIRESRRFVEAVNYVQSRKSPADAVAYLPFEDIAYRGEYFGLPASRDLGPGPARPPAFPRLAHASELGRPFVSKDFDAPSAWIIALARPGTAFQWDTEQLAAALSALSDHYHIKIEPDDLKARVHPDEWEVVRVGPDGWNCRSFPLR